MGTPVTPLTLQELKDIGDPKNIDAINAEIAAIAEKGGVDPGPQPRNNKGQFLPKTAAPGVKEETTTPVVEPEAEAQITEYRQEVEIAPGRSIVVTGATEAEVNLKAEIAQQTAATVLAAQKAKETPTPAPVVEEKKDKTPDELFALKMDYDAGRITFDEYLDQSGVLDRQLEKRGWTPEKKKEIEKELAEKQTKTEEQAWQEATTQFKAEHPEYSGPQFAEGTPLLKLFQYEVAVAKNSNPSFTNKEAIDSAYAKMNDNGWIKTEPEAAPVVAEPTTPAPPPKKKPTSSGVFGTDGRADARPGPVKTTAPPLTEAQWNKMTLSQQGEWMNAYIASQTGQKPPQS